MAGTLRIPVEKITARVFCQAPSSSSTVGGNPVTIFSSQQALSPPTKQRLAQTCQWESVVVDQQDSTLSFYMPTGEPVSFCAHAAMGGSMELSSHTLESARKEKDVKVKFQTTMETIGSQESTVDETIHTAILHPDDIVSLEMNCHFQQGRLSHPPTLVRVLREALKLSTHDLIQPPHMWWSSLPANINASVARPKTLVYVNTLEALHAAVPPPVTNNHFQKACDALDASTGIYLYSPRPPNDDPQEVSGMVTSWECRQFPRASGYPEDPATGIAAAALAVSLHKERLLTNPQDVRLASYAYRCYQGTAMNRPSLILVDNIRFLNNTTALTQERNEGQDEKVSFRLMGRIEVDERETVEVDNESSSQ